MNMIHEDHSILAAQDFETGQTCLHIAVQNGRTELVMVLLGYGADRNARDFAGRTFVDLARMVGASEEVVGRLVSS